MILLNPGPVTLSNRVRNALSGPDLCHREEEFSLLQQSIRDKLLGVYNLSNENWAPVLLTGSGTAAVEAMLISCIPEEGQTLVIENGVYGERMSEMLKSYAIHYDRHTNEWEANIDINSLRVMLSKKKYSHAVLVHHETTTGRLNELSEISELCARYGTKLLVDAVSSFGAEAIPFENETIAACAATANKCLHGVPGTSFVLLRRSLFKDTMAPRRSVYLDLFKYLKAQDGEGTPFTQSVQSFYALEEALKEFFDQGGRKSRYEIYKQRMLKISDVLNSLRIKPFLPSNVNSVVLRSFLLPSAKTYEEVHRSLKTQGFIIYAGQNQYRDKLFRISLMGDISNKDLSNLEFALGKTFS